ncbi:MAG: DUF433 domain-containing protein [Planctomycetota bacterium]
MEKRNGNGSAAPDLRDQPNYPLREAAIYLGVPASTIRVWALGGRYRTRLEGAKTAPPIFAPASRRPLTLSFLNLVEAYVLASIRRRHEISLQKIRKALRFVEGRCGIRRPLVEKEFLTDGVDLFVEHYSRLVNAVREGQIVFREVLVKSLRRIARDASGLPVRFSPWILSPAEPTSVEVDPGRAFGRLVVAGTGIPTESIAERFRAGDSVDHLACDFRLTRAQVEAALRWEQRASAA